MQLLAQLFVQFLPNFYRNFSNRSLYKVANIEQRCSLAPCWSSWVRCASAWIADSCSAGRPLRWLRRCLKRKQDVFHWHLSDGEWWRQKRVAATVKPLVLLHGIVLYSCACEQSLTRFEVKQFWVWSAYDKWDNGTKVELKRREQKRARDVNWKED